MGPSESNTWLCKLPFPSLPRLSPVIYLILHINFSLPGLLVFCVLQSNNFLSTASAIFLDIFHFFLFIWTSIFTLFDHANSFLFVISGHLTFKILLSLVLTKTCTYYLKTLSLSMHHVQQKEHSTYVVQILTVDFR